LVVSANLLAGVDRVGVVCDDAALLARRAPIVGDSTQAAVPSRLTAPVACRRLRHPLAVRCRLRRRHRRRRWRRLGLATLRLLQSLIQRNRYVAMLHTLRRHDNSRVVDASAGPPGGCRDTPGPASPTLYCIIGTAVRSSMTRATAARDDTERAGEREERHRARSGTTSSGGPHHTLANQLHLSSSTRCVATMVVQYGPRVSSDRVVAISATSVAHPVLLHLLHHVLQQRAQPERAHRACATSPPCRQSSTRVDLGHARKTAGN
jgi:hypothetical protein